MEKKTLKSMIKIGDKVRGKGFISFQDGFKIDRSPAVTVREHNGRIYCGALSIESFNELWVVESA